MRSIQRHRLLSVGAMSLALLVGFATAEVFAGAEGAACQFSSFSRKPLWTSAGFWNSSDLVVLDPVQRGLLRYGGDGRARRDVAGQSTKSLSDLYPVGVALRSDGQTGDGKIIVQAEYNRFLILSPTYTFDGSVDVLSRPTTEGSSIERIYTWAPTWSPKQNQNEVVAFADLKKGSQWSTGIVRFPLDSDDSAGRRAHFLKNLSVNDVSRKFHRLGYSYIASVQEDAYVLLMEDGFRLWRSDRAGDFTELTAFHESFPKTPTLPAFVRPTDYASIMSEIEEVEMPTGIVAWDNRLYVVWRTPHATNGTEWRVSEVDRKDGKIISKGVIIPSQANHLFAVPGKGSWAFIEKGPALGLRDQEVRNVITVFSQKLRSVMASAEQKSGGSQVALKLCD